MHELFVAHPLVKLLFADHLSPGELRGKLEQHAELVAARIAALESLGSVAPAEAATLGASLLDLELRQLRDRLDWLRELPPMRERGVGVHRGGDRPRTATTTALRSR